MYNSKKDLNLLGLDCILVHFSQVAKRFNTNVRVLTDLDDTVVSIDTNERAHVALPVTLQDHHVVLLLRCDTVQHVARQEHNFAAECDHAAVVCS